MLLFVLVWYGTGWLKSCDLQDTWPQLKVMPYIDHVKRSCICAADNLTENYDFSCVEFSFYLSGSCGFSFISVWNENQLAGTSFYFQVGRRCCLISLFTPTRRLKRLKLCITDSVHGDSCWLAINNRTKGCKICQTYKHLKRNWA